jgi:hypothetical protein
MIKSTVYHKQEVPESFSIDSLLLLIFFAAYIILKKETKTSARELKPKIPKIWVVASIIFYHIF